MTIIDTIARHLPLHKADDYDAEADARAGYARRMGHDLSAQERRARAIRLADSAPARRVTRAG